MPGPNRTTNKAIRADYAARAVRESSPPSESKNQMKKRMEEAQSAVSTGAPLPQYKR